MVNDNININNIVKKNIKGKYKIQLFDKNNNCIEEYKKHNAISNYFYDLFKQILYQNISLNSVYLRNLYLTYDENSSGSDETNAIIMGELIGCADDSSTAYPDSIRGIINNDECYVTYNKENGFYTKSKTVHLVYDFSSSRGNGTFNDIYLGYNGSRGTTDNMLENKNKILVRDTFAITYDSNSGSHKSDHGSISHSSEYIYIQNMQCYDGKTKYDTITKLDKINYKQTVIVLQVPDDSASKQAIVVYSGGLLWRIASDFSVTRYDLEGNYIDVISLKDHFTTSTSSFNPNNCSFTGDDNYLYFTNTESIVSVDKNNIKKSEVYTAGSFINLIQNSSKTYIAISNRYSYISNIYCINESNGGLILISNFFNTSSFSWGYSFIILNNNIFIGYTYNYSSDYNYMYCFAIIQPWTSHLHLDNPITKTSANTMKIQYDITIDYHK